MWKAATDVTAPALAEADDWETDPDFVNDISEHEQRWGPSGRNVEAIECKEDGVKGIEDKGVPNYVEEDGKHYPRSDSNLHNLVSILIEEMVANVQTKEMSQELVDSVSCQRVALLPSESCTHKESYVDVIQDKCDNNVNVDGNIKKEEQLNEQIEAKEQELSAKEGDIKIDEICNQRPHHTPTFCTVISHRGNQQLRQMNQSYPDYSPYKCDMCRNNFKSKAALQNHVNSHCGIKPHACKDCNSAFVRPSDLIRHIRYMHTREKPYKCNECDYASVESSKLRRHMRRHTAERPY